MRTVVHRSVVIGITFSLFVMLIVMAGFFIAFPFHSWMELWETKIFELPFIVMVPASSVVFGAIVGLIVGLFWKKQLTNMEQVLETLYEAKGVTIEKVESPVSEVALLFEKMEVVQRYMREQTKQTQKLIDERVQDQEAQVEKIISEERNRLARELHDSVSQELFAASMMVSAINESNHRSDIMSKQLQQVESMIQQAQLEMRALLLHLRPVALRGKTLKDGMKQLLEELKQKVPIEVDWNMEDVTVSKGVEDHLFRILQESLSNTLRHAKAQTLTVLLIERNQYVILQVSDDGIGFDVEENLSGSYGLMNMKERAAEMGAKLRVISVPNEGTRLEVRVPIMDVEGDEHD